MPTKLGAHVLRTAGDLGDYVQAKPAVVKLVAEWGMVKDAPEGVLVIGRKYQGDYDAQHQYKDGLEPKEAVRRFLEDQRPTYEANPDIVYWEGHNEPVWNTEEEMAWYAEFEIERMRQMADLGLKCVIGTFPAGNPKLDLWSEFVPACQAGREYEAILALHEGSCPWLWWMYGDNQVDPDEDQGDEGWMTFRYRKIYRQHLIPNDAVIPLVVSELTIDPMVRPLPPDMDSSDAGTWKGLGNFWREHDNEPDKADYYYRQLVWYDKELQKDDYVVGATIFTWGSFGKPWSDHDVAGTDVSKKLVAYTRENPGRDFVWGDFAEVEDGDNGDDEERGQPRIQYERTYVLLPPDADVTWTRAVIEGSWDAHRYTIGGSADDAGIGDLDVRRVIAVNPQEWQGDLSLEDFFAQYYPDVEYQSITAATPEELTQKLASE